MNIPDDDMRVMAGCTNLALHFVYIMVTAPFILYVLVTSLIKRINLNFCT